MHSPALAMGWELWGKNRLGILATFGLLAACSVPCFLISHAVAEEIVTPLSIPLFFVLFVYLISIFTHPEFQSRTQYAGLPARKFFLPVHTVSLVSWHMLYGVAALIVLWMAMALCIWLPAGITPAWWLLPLLAVIVVWMQAICWSIPRPALLQIFVACTVFPILKIGLELTADLYRLNDRVGPDPAAFLRNRPLIVSTFAVCAVSLAYAAALVGVWRVRHGMGAGRDFWQKLLARMTLPAFPRQKVFTSPWTAQVAYELRALGLWFLRLFVPSYLLFLTLVGVPFVREAGAFLEAFIFMMVLMLIIAYCAGYGLGKPGFWGELGFRPWDAVKPMTSGSMALAKIHAAARSALVTWLMVAALIPIWLMLGGLYPGVAQAMHRASASLNVFQAAALAPLTLLALLALTWGQIIAGLGLSLTSRGWVVNAVTLFAIALVAVFVVSWRWVYLHPSDRNLVWTAWTWVAGFLIALKLMGAAYMLHLGLRRGLVRWQQMLQPTCMWLVGSLCVVAVLYWILPDLTVSTLVPRKWWVIPSVPSSLTALLGILAMPLLRLTAAPLAVAWSRHR